MYMYVLYVCTTAQPNILYDVHWGCVYLISSLAEELFMRSWKVYETLFGESHLMVVRPLRNLAFFYMQRDKWVVCVCVWGNTHLLHMYVSLYIHILRIFSLEKATSLFEKAHEILMQVLCVTSFWWLLGHVWGSFSVRIKLDKQNKWLM